MLENPHIFLVKTGSKRKYLWSALAAGNGGGSPSLKGRHDDGSPLTEGGYIKSKFD